MSRRRKIDEKVNVSMKNGIRVVDISRFKYVTGFLNPDLWSLIIDYFTTRELIYSVQSWREVDREEQLITKCYVDIVRVIDPNMYTRDDFLSDFWWKRLVKLMVQVSIMTEEIENYGEKLSADDQNEVVQNVLRYHTFNSEIDYYSSTVHHMKVFGTLLNRPFSVHIQTYPRRRDLGEYSTCLKRQDNFFNLMNEAGGGMKNLVSRSAIDENDFAFSFNMTLPMKRKKEKKNYHGTFNPRGKDGYFDIVNLQDTMLPVIPFESTMRVFDATTQSREDYNTARKEYEDYVYIHPYGRVEKKVKEHKESLLPISYMLVDFDLDEETGVFLHPFDCVGNDLLSSQESLKDMTVRSDIIHDVYVQNETDYHRYLASRRDWWSGEITKLDQERRFADPTKKKEIKLQIDGLLKKKKQYWRKVASMGLSKRILLLKMELSKVNLEVHSLKGNEKSRKITVQNRLKNEISYLEIEQSSPSVSLSEYRVSDYIYLERKVGMAEDENNVTDCLTLPIPNFGQKKVYLCCGITIKESEDGHGLLGQFTQKFKRGEEGFILNNPFAAYPDDLENHSIMGVALMKENADQVERILHPLSEVLDFCQSKCLWKFVNYATLFEVLERENENLRFCNYLVRRKKLRKRDQQQIKKDGGLWVCFYVRLMGMDDWAAAVLRRKKNKSLYSPLNNIFRRNRKVEELDYENHGFTGSEQFDHSGDLTKRGYLRGEGNVIHKKEILVTETHLDFGLHGNTRNSNGGMEGLVLFGSEENIGMKAKLLSVLEYFKVYDTSKSVTKKAGMKMNHIQAKNLRNNEDAIRLEIRTLINDKKKYFQKQMKKKKKKEDIEKQKRKIEVCDEILTLNELYLRDILELARISDHARVVYRNPDYKKHDESWIRMEFMNFKFVKDRIVPIVNRIQEISSRIVKKTNKLSYYLSYVMREFVIFAVIWWTLRMNNRTVELCMCVLNRLHRHGSNFAGRESKNPKKMRVAGTNQLRDVKRKTDQQLGVLARFRRKKKARRQNKEKYRV